MELFRQFGISLQAQAPDSLLEHERAASLIGIFGTNLASTNVRIDTSLAITTSADTPAAPTVEDLTPYDCQQLWPDPTCTTQECKNPCMYCCQFTLALNGTVCRRLCQKRNLGVSPSDPTP